MATATMYKMASGSYSISCTYANLPTATSRCSTAIDASATRYIDALLSVTVQLTTGAATGNDNAIYVYIYGKVAGASGYTDNVSGADANLILREPNNLFGPYVIAFVTATGAPQAVGGPWSVANAFGGHMPSEWGIVVQNKTNSILSTASNCQASYMKIWHTAE